MLSEDEMVNESFVQSLVILKSKDHLGYHEFVCLFEAQVGLPGPSDFVDRLLTPGKYQCIS